MGVSNYFLRRVLFFYKKNDELSTKRYCVRHLSGTYDEPSTKLLL